MKCENCGRNQEVCQCRKPWSGYSDIATGSSAIEDKMTKQEAEVKIMEILKALEKDTEEIVSSVNILKINATSLDDYSPRFLRMVRIGTVEKYYGEWAQ